MKIERVKALDFQRYFADHLNKCSDEVVMLVVRRNKKNVVVMSTELFTALLENLTLNAEKEEPDNES